MTEIEDIEQQHRVMHKRAADAAVESVARVLPQWLMYVIVGISLLNAAYSFETRREAKLASVRSIKNESRIIAIEKVDQLAERVDALSEQLEASAKMTGLLLDQLARAQCGAGDEDACALLNERTSDE